MSCLFGMLLEGLPAAVVLIPVVFPIAETMGIDPIHFNIVQTAAVGIGLFLPPMGVGLLMALRFANLSVGQHFGTYVPYMLALFAGLLLIICIPEISLTLPRLAGLIKSQGRRGGHRAPSTRSTGPRPGPISAAPTGVITEMRCSSRLSSAG